MSAKHVRGQPGRRGPRQKLRAVRRGRKDQSAGQAPITNQTVAAYREQVLHSSRRYIYPLGHSRRAVVSFSAKLLAVLIVAFFVFCGLLLYKFQNDSSLTYQITEVLPFPVAKAGSRWVSYESYLFQLRRHQHYYISQQDKNFHTPQGQRQLAAYKRQALKTAINNAYVKQLADRHHVSVSPKEVTQEVNLLRHQNRLGADRQQFASVLQKFWGWSIADFRRELRLQLRAQKVVAALDQPTHRRVKQALAKLSDGTSFAKVAKQYSDDDSSKNGGGKYGFAISRDSRAVPPQVVSALFKLKKGQTSGIINAGYSLQIVKLLSKKDGQVRAAHIAFHYADINDYLKPLKHQSPPHRYITVKDAPKKPS